MCSPLSLQPPQKVEVLLSLPFLEIWLQAQTPLQKGWVHSMMLYSSLKSSLTFWQTIECGFTLKLVCGMIITYNQVHRTDKYSQHSSIIWPVS